LKKILDEAVAGLKIKADKKSLSLVVGTEDAIVTGDGILLHILFSNLIDNAIKACDEGGTVTASISKDNNRITVSITDNGKGMSEENLLHITEPFYRTDKSRSRAEGGAGLGLALCKQIVLPHHAEITFSSEIKKGTTVTVYFTFP
jgi:two-component system OmpR family sensor kinase